ncbi:MAG TPA: Smr/MutS family protein [Vicinamibacterales bacterium]|nr:Smr/MutS family protein [Vicinamibacterales bacterium]
MEDDPVHIPIEDSIDLHAFAPRDVVSVVDEYLHAALAAGFEEVRLIHGRGKGVQRADIQRLLRQHPVVERYWDAPESHLGATVVRLTSSAATPDS